MDHVFKQPFRAKITAIIDMQFGSTGKGLIAGYIAKRDQPDAVVTAWAANAGHTFIDSTTGRKHVHTMLANGVVSPALERIFIGPGSIINPYNLMDELEDFYGEQKAPRLIIHPHAAVIYEHHREAEAAIPGYTKIGSTKKGVAEAAIQRMRRGYDDANVAMNDRTLAPFVVTVEEYIAEMLQCRHLLVEGAQGYSLSMYHGMYPYTTSRDVSVHQVFADCGIPRAMVEGSQNSCTTRVIGTMRTYPIRVANRFDETGKQIGTSGPCYPDQREMKWSELGMEAELTTVTKLPRRIFTFSNEQIRQALSVLAPDEIFVNFVNYLPLKDVEPFFMNLNAIIKQSATPAAEIKYLGFGPAECDVCSHYVTLDAVISHAKSVIAGE